MQEYPGRVAFEQRAVCYSHLIRVFRFHGHGPCYLELSSGQRQAALVGHLFGRVLFQYDGVQNEHLPEGSEDLRRHKEERLADT